MAVGMAVPLCLAEDKATFPTPESLCSVSIRVLDGPALVNQSCEK
jgi:hypothetical protein